MCSYLDISPGKLRTACLSPTSLM
ncbi:MAG: hypothetical protein QOI53_2808, partial [Verrucomicrobiota bacterium]|nr:hypothetical protein [Verrucomicrobiota bacterium]